MDYKEFFEEVNDQLGLTSKSSYVYRPHSLTTEDLFSPSDKLLSLAESAEEHGLEKVGTVEFSGNKFQVAYMSDHGSIKHDGAEINHVYAVFKDRKFLFYFRVYGTYSSYDDPVWEDPTEWQIVNPKKVENYVWSIR